MRKQGLTPLILTVIGYILGIILGNFFVGAKYFLFLVVSLSLIVLASIFYLIFQQKYRTIALAFSILGFLFLGIARHQEARLIPPDDVSRHISLPTHKISRLTGVVISIPDKSSQRVNFALSCEKLTTDEGEIEVGGKTQVFLSTSDSTEIDFGDRVSLSGRLSIPPASVNPGLFNYRKYLEYQNIHSLFSVYRSEDIKRLERPRIGIFRFAILIIRQKIDFVIKSTLPQLESSILAGLLLGERRSLDKNIQEMFVDAGVLHTLAVSGLNVALVLFIFFAFFRGVGIPKKTSYFLTIFVVILYAEATGGRPSAIRAAIMATCGLVAFLLDRERHLYNSLALAALIILLLNPFALFDVGFQLSFMATLGILYLTPYFQTYLYLVKRNRSFNYLLSSLAVSAGALAGVYPITALYFNKVSLIALISNILVVPQVGIITALGFSSSILGLFSLVLAKVINTINRLIIVILFKCIQFFASLPFSSQDVVSPPLIFILAYYLFFALLPRIESSRLARRSILLFPVFFLFLINGRRFFAPDRVRINFLAVGQGDAIHIRLPDSRDILIDGGGALGKFSVGDRVLIPYLLKNGVSSIDTVFLTHPHYSHLRGLIPVLEKLKVKRVYCNRQNYNDDLVEEFFRIIKKKGIYLKYIASGEKIEYGGVRFQILNPGILREDVDANSLVLKMNYGNFRILFTGDISCAVQDELSGEEVESDVLQIPNHGKVPISPKFLYKVAPKYGIISRKFRMRKLEDKWRNIKFFSTSKNGAVGIRTDGKSFKIGPVREWQQ